MNREKEGEKEKAYGWDIERQIIEKNKQRDRKTEWGRNNRKTEKENRQKRDDNNEYEGEIMQR